MEVPLKTLGEYNLPIALCRLVLKGEHWLPVGVNTKLTPAHRSSSDGPIVWASLMAVVDGDQIVAWTDACFTTLTVNPNGQVEALDLRFIATVMDARTRDTEAEKLGAIGINRKLLERNPNSQAWTPPEHLRQSAFERATLMMRDKVHSKRTTGVIMVFSHIIDSD